MSNMCNYKSINNQRSRISKTVLNILQSVNTTRRVPNNRLTIYPNRQVGSNCNLITSAIDSFQFDVFSFLVVEDDSNLVVKDVHIQSLNTSSRLDDQTLITICKKNQRGKFISAEIRIPDT